MFKNFNLFREQSKESSPGKEHENLAKKLTFSFDAEQDFEKARKLAEKISDSAKREQMLAEITEIAKGKTPKLIEGTKRKPEYVLGGSDLKVEDLKDAINSGDLKDAKRIASFLAEEDENYAAMAYLEIARAEIEKGVNPQKTIIRAREIAKGSEDPWHQIVIFADIMKLYAQVESLEEARKTAEEIKSIASKRDWPEYNANVFAIIAQTERQIGLTDEEIKSLDENTIKSLTAKNDPNILSAINHFRQRTQE